MPLPEHLIGWDIGGAHVKASWVQRGGAGPLLRDAAEWACPLWQGLDPLRAALRAATERWPAACGATHAVTMTGEMVDLFEHREAGVKALAAELAAGLEGPLRFFAGAEQQSAWPDGAPRAGTGRDGPARDSAQGGAARWCGPGEVPAQWRAIASANWLTTAQWSARRVADGVLVDIGSTTTDLIALRAGRPALQGRSDADRLASGELVYHGVVRTPLATFAPRIAFRGRLHNVMNEFFATSADVYRLTGELDPAHDLQPSADGAAKDLPSSRRRLARMIGLDARDAPAVDWQALAGAWREAQLAELRRNLVGVIEAAGLPAAAPLVSAGCGDFLAAALAQSLGRPCIPFATLALGASQGDAALARRVQVAAPSAAVALLCAAALDGEGGAD